MFGCLSEGCLSTKRWIFLNIRVENTYGMGVDGRKIFMAEHNSHEITLHNLVILVRAYFDDENH